MTKFRSKLVAFDTVPSEDNSIFVRTRGAIQEPNYPHVMEISARTWKAEVSRVTRLMENIPEGTSESDKIIHYQESVPRITFEPITSSVEHHRQHRFVIWMKKDDPLDFDLIMEYIEGELSKDEKLEEANE